MSRTRRRLGTVIALLLLLPLTMAPKIAWDLDGLSADVVTTDTAREGRPFPVVILVDNISGVVQEDVVVRARISVGGDGSDITLVGHTAECGSSAGNEVWCFLGDVAVGERRTVRFVAVPSDSGTLSVALDRPGELS